MIPRHPTGFSIRPHNINNIRYADGIFFMEEKESKLREILKNVVNKLGERTNHPLQKDRMHDC